VLAGAVLINCRRGVAATERLSCRGPNGLYHRSSAPAPSHPFLDIRSDKKLEQELGVRLFNRGRNRLTLTGSGKLFLENVSPAMEKLRRAETMVKDTTGPLTGNIVIASVYDIKQYYLPMLASFAKSHKDINLTISRGITPRSCRF
jgi:hypothetical protein